MKLGHPMEIEIEEYEDGTIAVEFYDKDGFSIAGVEIVGARKIIAICLDADGRKADGATWTISGRTGR